MRPSHRRVIASDARAVSICLRAMFASKTNAMRANRARLGVPGVVRLRGSFGATGAVKSAWAAAADVSPRR